MQKSFEHWLVRILFNNFKEMSDLYTEKNVRIWGPVSVFIYFLIFDINLQTHSCNEDCLFEQMRTDQITKMNPLIDWKLHKKYLPLWRSYC